MACRLVAFFFFFFLFAHFGRPIFRAPWPQMGRRIELRVIRANGLTSVIYVVPIDEEAPAP